LTDHISLGVSTAQFPRELIDRIRVETERLNGRERALPAPLILYYVIAMARYAEVSTEEGLRCVVEGARWLGDPTTAALPTKSAILQARMRMRQPLTSRRVRPGSMRPARFRSCGSWGWSGMGRTSSRLRSWVRTARASACSQGRCWTP
jgi:hypothetical protein